MSTLISPTEGPERLGSWWLCFQICGWVGAFWVTFFFARRHRHTAGALANLFSWATLAAPVVALGIDAPAAAIWSSHKLSFSFLGVVLTIFVLALILPQDNAGQKNVLAYASLLLAMYGCVAKIGCFFGDCCRGTSFFLGLPLQLMESAAFGILVVACGIAITYEKQELSWAIFMSGYSFMRFLADFGRDERDILIWSFSYSQISILGAAFLLMILFRKYYYDQSNNHQRSFAGASHSEIA